MDNSEIDIETIKNLQINILRAVHLFCCENKIPYSLACGTMLGAVRHKGYIPWDDDIDIYLLRQDYERLVELFPSQYDNHIEFISLERNSKWDRPYAKAFDNRTLVKENAFCDVQIGIGVDVYPVDDVPDDEKAWKRYDRKRRLIQNALSIKRMKFVKSRGIIKNLTMSVLKFLTFFVTKRRFAEIIDSYSKKNNGKGFQSVFECVQGMLQKNRFDKTLFSSLSLYQFEDQFFYGFSDYDSYLRPAYGNYMELPPIEKRVIHHDYSAYLRQPQP